MQSKNNLRRKLNLKRRWQVIFEFGGKKIKSLGVRPDAIEDLVDESREEK